MLWVLASSTDYAPFLFVESALHAQVPLICCASKCYKSPSNEELLFVRQDCLACSGCVTSAETVLLEHQSAAEFLSKLADPGITVVVSISPQSRAALAAFHGLSPAEALQKLTGFFKGQGVKAVLDTSIGRDFSLLEAAAEFVQRYRERHPELSGPHDRILPW